MDPDTLQEVASKIQQMGAVSALLGGLSFSAAISLLASGAVRGETNKLGRSAAITIGFAMACAACQIVATIAWTFLALNLDAEIMTDDMAKHLRRWGSQAFILGILLLFISISVSGWIASRWLGAVTTIIGVLSGFWTLYIIFIFVN